MSFVQNEVKVKYETGVRILENMLHFRRPAFSKTERRFVRTYLESLPGVYKDMYGNVIGRIGEAPVLWSSHTDTVHIEGGIQSLARSGAYIHLADDENISNCLGGDCSTGVWIMREMYLAGVEGLYIWHRSEEIGGLGSSHIADKTPELVHGIKVAIALDRMGSTSIITHQAGGRCASQAFAASLSSQLGSAWRADASGLFTDTANYTRLIPECTNLSVGYSAAHSSNERQDTDFAEALLESLKILDIAALTIDRDPTSNRFDGFYDFGHWNRYQEDFNAESFRGMTMLDLVELYPKEIAAMLEQYGYDERNLLQDIRELRGMK